MVMVKAEAEDVLFRVRRGNPVTREEVLEAARFYLTVSSTRRSSKAKALEDVRTGLWLLEQAGFVVPPIEEFGRDGYLVSARAAEWFARRFLGAE